MAQRQFDIAAEVLGLDPNMQRVLRECKRELIVTFPVLMDDRTVQMFTGYRVHHNIDRGPAKNIPAPDVNTKPQTMAGMRATTSMRAGHSVRGVVTGKPLASAAPRAAP